MFCITPLCRKQRKLSRLGTNFCLGCLAERSLIGERERERENSLHYKNNLYTLNKILVDYSISNKEYNNINLLNEYLESLHDKVLPKCECCITS